MDKCLHGVCENMGKSFCIVPNCDHCAFKKIRHDHAHNVARRLRDMVYRDAGMVKVRGSLGGTYWE